MATPTTSILDDFNRANSNSLGANWGGPIFSGSRNGINNNMLQPRGTDSGNEYSTDYWLTPCGPDCDVYLTVVTEGSASATGGMELLARLQRFATDDINAYSLFGNHDHSNSFTFNRYDRGVFTQLGASISVTVNDGDAFWLNITGNVLTGYRKASGAGDFTQFGTRTDNTYSGAGNIGLAAEGSSQGATGHRLDDFGGGTVGGVSTPISSSDSGSATELATVVVRISNTQTGAGTDANSLAVLQSFTQLGSGTDQGTVSTIKSGSDQGSGNDLATLLSAISNTQVGSGTDNQSLASLVAGIEIGGLTDSVSLRAILAASDSAILSDSFLALVAALTGTDAASGTDSGNIAVGVVHVNSSDSGSGSESVTLVTALNGTEVTAGTDGQTVIFTLPVQTDFGASTDTVFIAIPVSSSDSGVLSDSGLLRAVLTGQELGVGADTLQTLRAVLAALESVAGVETQELLTTLFGSDQGVGTEIGHAMFGVKIIGGAAYMLGADGKTDLISASRDAGFVLSASDPGELK